MISVTELIKQHCPKIDWEKKAKEKAKAEGVSTETILKEWERARDNGLIKGKLLHDSKCKDYAESDNYIKYTYQPIGSDFIYNEDNYKVVQGLVYDEKPFVSPKYNLIGIPDRVIVRDGFVDIYDFKSDKAIYKTAKVFRNGRFVTKQKMTSPIDHLDYCNYIEYNLQLSLYMRLVLDNNPNLRPGKLFILHTLHDEDTLDPLEEITYEVPFLRKEVNSLLKKIKK